MKQPSSKTEEDDKLKWWQLSLLGIAGTIGTGYFLGSGLAISMGGTSSTASLHFSCYWNICRI